MSAFPRSAFTGRPEPRPWSDLVWLLHGGQDFLTTTSPASTDKLDFQPIRIRMLHIQKIPGLKDFETDDHERSPTIH